MQRTNLLIAGCSSALLYSISLIWLNEYWYVAVPALIVLLRAVYILCNAKKIVLLLSLWSVIVVFTHYLWVIPSFKIKLEASTLVAGVVYVAISLLHALCFISVFLLAAAIVCFFKKQFRNKLLFRLFLSTTFFLSFSIAGSTLMFILGGEGCCNLLSPMIPLSKFFMPRSASSLSFYQIQQKENSVVVDGLKIINLKIPDMRALRVGPWGRAQQVVYALQKLENKGEVQSGIFSIGNGLHQSVVPASEPGSRLNQKHYGLLELWRLWLIKKLNPRPPSLDPGSEAGTTGRGAVPQWLLEINFESCLQKITIITTPESCIAYPINREPELFSFIQQAIAPNQRLLLAAQYQDTDDRLFQAVYLLTTNQDAQLVYLKQHAVPCFERMPRYLESFSVLRNIFRAEKNFSYVAKHVNGNGFLIDDVRVVPRLCSDFFLVTSTADLVKLRLSHRESLHSEPLVVVLHVNDTWFAPSMRSLLNHVARMRAWLAGVDLVYVGYASDGDK